MTRGYIDITANGLEPKMQTPTVEWIRQYKTRAMYRGSVRKRKKGLAGTGCFLQNDMRAPQTSLTRALARVVAV